MHGRRYPELLLWQAAMTLTEAFCEPTPGSPADERFGLARQMRRAAAVSIRCNTDEGAARGRKKEFPHLMTISRGSLSERDPQLAPTLRFPGEYARPAGNIQRTCKLLGGLIKPPRAELGPLITHSSPLT